MNGTMSDAGSPSTQEAATFGVAVFVLGLVTVVLAGFGSFPRIASGLLFTMDSAAYAVNAKEYFADGTFTRLIASYTQSFGNLLGPDNFNLLPEVRLAYIDGRIDPVIMYVLASSFLFSATFVVVMTIGFGPLIALASSLTMVFLTMPFTSPPIYTMSFWWFSPYWIPNTYMMMALLVTYCFIGRYSAIASLLAILLLFLEVLWVIVGVAKGSFTLLLGAGWFFMAMMIASAFVRELAWKVLGTLAVVSLVVFTGPLDFVRGLHTYTGNMLFIPSLQRHETFDPLALLAALFYPPPYFPYVKEAGIAWVHLHLGYPLTFLSILGAGWTVASPPTRTARCFAIAVLTIFPVLLLFLYGMGIGGAMYPLLVMFAIVGLFRTARWLCQISWRYINISRTGSSVSGVVAAIISKRWATVALIMIVAVGFVFLARYRQTAPAGWSYPPSRPPLIDVLGSKIRFGLGDQFRGRYLDMSITLPIESGVLPAGDTLASALNKSAYDHVITYGNDLTVHGPRFYDIPVATESNRMSTPFSVLFHNFLLIEEGEKERLDQRQITHFDARLFRLLGVRYVLSHRPLLGNSVSRVPGALSPVGTALYEIGGVNVGQYSPSEIDLVPEWRAALEKIAASDFDPLRMAVIHDDWVGKLPLAPGKGVIVRPHDGYRVIATSAGRSLLVLPFEFSRCLVVSDQRGVAQIGRVNFFLTGIVFEKEVDAVLQFRFGPFENARCRLADMRDVRAMGLDSASFGQFRTKYPSRFLIEGIF